MDKTKLMNKTKKITSMRELEKLYLPNHLQKRLQEKKYLLRTTSGFMPEILEEIKKEFINKFISRKND